MPLNLGPQSTHTLTAQTWRQYRVGVALRSPLTDHARPLASHTSSVLPWLECPSLKSFLLLLWQSRQRVHSSTAQFNTKNVWLLTFLQQPGLSFSSSVPLREAYIKWVIAMLRNCWSQQRPTGAVFPPPPTSLPPQTLPHTLRIKDTLLG